MNKHAAIQKTALVSHEFLSKMEMKDLDPSR